MKTKNADNFRNACEAASQVFTKLKIEKYTPEGLIEFGMIAKEELKAFKLKNPRKVNKKVIADLEKYSKN